MAERPAAPVDSAFNASAFDRALDQRLPTRWIGWRLRLLVVAALIGCVGLFALMRWLAASPALDAVFQASPQGPLKLIGSPAPALNAFAGRGLSAVVGTDGVAVPLDALA